MWQTNISGSVCKFQRKWNRRARAHHAHIPINEKELQPKIHLRSMGTKWKWIYADSYMEIALGFWFYLCCASVRFFFFGSNMHQNPMESLNIPFVFQNEHKYELMDEWKPFYRYIMSNLSSISLQRAKRYGLQYHRVMLIHLKRDSIESKIRFKILLPSDVAVVVKLLSFSYFLW